MAANGSLNTVSSVTGIVAGTIGAISNIVGMVKNLDDFKEDSKAKKLELYSKANISVTLSQKESEEYMKEREKILNKNTNKEKIERRKKRKGKN